MNESFVSRRAPESARAGEDACEGENEEADVSQVEQVSRVDVVREGEVLKQRVLEHLSQRPQLIKVCEARRDRHEKAEDVGALNLHEAHERTARAGKEDEHKESETHRAQREQRLRREEETDAENQPGQKESRRLPPARKRPDRDPEAREPREYKRLVGSDLDALLREDNHEAEDDHGEERCQPVVRQTREGVGHQEDAERGEGQKRARGEDESRPFFEKMKERQQKVVEQRRVRLPEIFVDEEVPAEHPRRVQMLELVHVQLAVEGERDAEDDGEEKQAEEDEIEKTTRRVVCQPLTRRFGCRVLAHLVRSEERR